MTPSNWALLFFGLAGLVVAVALLYELSSWLFFRRKKAPEHVASLGKFEDKPAATPPMPPIPELTSPVSLSKAMRLAELKTLRDTGQITPEDYDAAKIKIVFE